MSEELFKKLISHTKKYGFIFQSSEIYDGLSAVYDYGPYGAELKNNIREYWWKSMVQLHDNIVGLDSAIFMHPATWKASGHVDAFNDPLIDNKDSKKRYRADVLIEDHVAGIEAKIEKEVAKARKRFAEQFDENKFRAEHPRVKEYNSRISDINSRFNEAMTSGRMDELKNLIEELGIVDPVSGSRNWTDVRQFNLMFSTQLGNISGEEDKLYLRPETAQGIFVNFLNVQKTTRQKIPFGIAQTGKAFRNEIVARQFVFRMKEFEQMEMQYFVVPGEEMKWYSYWKEMRMKWHLSVNPNPAKLKYHDHENLAHYANAAVDIQFEFPFGFKELEGIHSRTDFDLRNHQELSGKKLQYFDPETNENFIPYVVETSIGLDRMFLSVLSNAYNEEMVADASGGEAERVVLKIPPQLAPVKVAVLPLVKNKDELTSKALEIFDKLKLFFNIQYDDKDTIGRRYRRQDAIGTPYCITIDFETISDNAVTVRDRDTLEQVRMSIDELIPYLDRKTNMAYLLAELIQK